MVTLLEPWMLHIGLPLRRSDSTSLPSREMPNRNLLSPDTSCCRVLPGALLRQRLLELLLLRPSLAAAAAAQREGGVSSGARKLEHSDSLDKDGLGSERHRLP